MPTAINTTNTLTSHRKTHELYANTVLVERKIEGKKISAPIKSEVRGRGRGRGVTAECQLEPTTTSPGIGFQASVPS
jgi:hypothetical protein